MPDPSSSSTLPPIESSALGHLLLSKVDNAIKELQKAQEMFVNTTESLTSHDADEMAHPAIRAKIASVIAGTGFATMDAVNEKLDQIFHDHNTSETSHSNIQANINALKNELDVVKKRLAKLEPQGGGGSAQQTELEKRLRAIDAYYDPTLAQLQRAWDLAIKQNKPTANDIAKEYQQVLAAKTEARMKVLKEFAQG